MGQKERPNEETEREKEMERIARERERMAGSIGRKRERLGLVCVCVCACYISFPSSYCSRRPFLLAPSSSAETCSAISAPTPPFLTMDRFLLSSVSSGSSRSSAASTTTSLGLVRESKENIFQQDVGHTIPRDFFSQRKLLAASHHASLSRLDRNSRDEQRAKGEKIQQVKRIK